MIWPGPHTSPGVITLRLRISHPLMPTCSARRSSTPSMANWAWLAPKPRKAPHTGLLVRTATDSHVDGGHVVRARWRGRRPARAPSCRRWRRSRSRRSPGPAAPVSAAVGVAAGPVLHADRVALGVHEQALLAGERALHRALQEPGGQRRLRLVGHVLLAAEGAAVGDELDGDPVGARRRAREAIWLRSSHTPWPPEYTCRRRAVVVGRARPAWTRARGRRARCAGSGRPRARRGRWPASAASTSPRGVLADATARCESVPHTAISGSSMAATASVIGRSTS